MAELKEMKRKTREKRKAYWATQQKLSQPPPPGGCPDKGHSEIVNPGANTEAVFQHQSSDSQIETPITGNDSLVESVLSH
jgi:hypothetical protein